MFVDDVDFWLEDGGFWVLSDCGMEGGDIIG